MNSIMSADTVCRVCLLNNLNLYGVRNDLRNAFERITRQKYNKVGYPLSMCYICLAVLEKCHRFMETARDTNNVLKQWSKQQNEMEVAQPLYVYSVSKVELVSTADEGVPLQQYIKTEEEDLEPENVEYNTGMDIEKTDTDEQTDNKDLSVDSPKDSTYSENEEDNNDREPDPLFHSMDIEETSSLDSKMNVRTIIGSKLEVISANADGASPIKKRKTETTCQQQSPETSGETGANSETSNDIIPLNTSPTQLDNIIHIENKIKPTLDNKRINKQIRKLNKSRKTNNAIQRRNEYCCDMCNYKTTLSKYQLICHIRTHTGEKPYSCNVCSYKCARKGNIKIHMKTHTGLKPFSCDFCNKAFAHSCNLKTHMRSHTGEKPFSCNICSHKFAQKSHLNTHLKTHTAANSETSYNITPLNTSPSQPDNLIHRETDDIKPTLDNKFTNKQTPKLNTSRKMNNEIPKKRKEHCCDLCNYKTTHGKSKLIRHMRTHTGEKPFYCNICSKTFALKSGLKYHMLSHTGEKPFFCDICGYRAALKIRLKAHMIRHTGKKPFSCNICSYRSVTKCDMKSHMRKHTGEKPFCCYICGNQFGVQCTLKAHMLTHTGEKPYSCNVCSYRCALKCSLNSHMKTHTGEKPFSCDICNKTFAHSWNLKSHMKIHTGEKSYICDVCDIKFSKKRDLVNHKRTHTTYQPLTITNHKIAEKDDLKHLKNHTSYKPISCSICSYKCSQMSHLNEHMRVHSGEKPFPCDMCNRKFSLKQALKRHVRTHTGEKPFACDVCNYRCTQKCNLKAHMRTHTGETPFSCDICDCKFVKSHNLKLHIETKHSTKK